LNGGYWWKQGNVTNKNQSAVLKVLFDSEGIGNADLKDEFSLKNVMAFSVTLVWGKSANVTCWLE